jgi:ubiquinone/menaquinone biosynthesis C-methylase UbiE
MLHSSRLASRARTLARKLRAFAGGRLSNPLEYQLAKTGDALSADGWKVQSAASRQHEAFQQLLQDASAGNPRVDFQVAARAIASTGLADPLVIEVGCGSGYYSEVLSLLLRRPLRYVGIDFSQAMVGLAHVTYQQIPFLAGDACRLPLQDGSCDILLNGTSLMHIANYRQAIAESVRVSREWCIFHTVPLVARRKTTLTHKLAYGQRVVEIIFNQAELESILRENKLTIHEVFESIPYDVSAVLGEPSWTLTYLCRKI